MNTLTGKQKELLRSNIEDLKAIVLKWARYTDSGVRTLEADFDSFASQFEPEWKILNWSGRYADEIFKVQYKSETLTVGDETNCGVITGFKVVDNKMRVLWKGSVCHQWADISEVKKIERKPRFVTDGDGEEIFDGDKYHYIWTDNIPLKINTRICDGALYEGNQEYTTYFKSKEKAEKYILLNAPRLSVNDVMKVVGQYVFDPSFYKDKLVELVKSKL